MTDMTESQRTLSDRGPANPSVRANIPSLLLADQYAPITNEIGFIELPHAEALAAYIGWQKWIRGSLAACTAISVEGDLPTILRQLQPLTFIEERTRVVLVPTASPWTAVFDNRDYGADLRSTMITLAKRTTQRSMRISIGLHVVDTIARRTGGLPWCVVDLRGAEQRVLSAWVNDSGRWTWDAIGPVQ